MLYNDKAPKPKTSIYEWLFQLDDVESLHGCFHKTQVFSWRFQVPSLYLISELLTTLLTSLSVETATCVAAKQLILGSVYNKNNSKWLC